ncbi:acid phosphatase pho5 [Aspergillus hancockii]|nr:acid phosphatase pho5 [Aspergillus hancockii]
MPSALSFWTLTLSILTAFIGVSYYTRNPSASAIGSSPYCASWNTWYHPFQSPSHQARIGSYDNDWNLLYHLGGNGPWVEKIDGPNARGVDPPNRCTIDQLHMISRHGERYPTKSAGGRHLALLSRIKEANVVLNGSLSFLNEWTYFTDEPQEDFEQLTRTGPYAGTLQEFSTGVRFLTRYGHLLSRHAITRLWASDCERVIESAQHFASGLFGLNWERHRKAVLEIIPETLDRRADTLTPADTCPKYIEDPTKGHDNGVNMLALFQNAYIPAIAERLISDEQNTALGHLTNLEVYSMQEMCGFETIARGSSPWCDIFTHEDWENFEYARDLIHYYRAGPGNPYAGAMGWLWLNATTALLRSGPEVGTMFFSFVHDGDIAPFLTALDIMRDPKYDPYLPTTHRATDRVWRTSSVMPMGGRIVLERLTCPVSAESSNDKNTFLRVNINDKNMPLPYCKSGPGLSCPLEEFVSHVERRRLEVGEFGEVCGLEGDAGYITFLRQD